MKIARAQSILTATSTTENIPAPKTNKQLVQEAFSAHMVRVIGCESQFRQFSSNGDPLMSPTADVGLLQINQVWWKTAKSMGLDIFGSTTQNIQMGLYILKTQGETAWTCNTMVK